jgi:hypothetical protein
MRIPSKTADLSTRDMISPAAAAQAGGCNPEIAIGETEVQDFRTWWMAHVKETRYWGGGPDGVWSGTAANIG